MDMENVATNNNITSSQITCINMNKKVNVQIIELIYNTIIMLFQRDKDGELSYEIVQLIAKLVVEVKYNVVEDVIRCLEYIKLTVHINESKTIHQKSKQEKRKRKKFDVDDVEAGLLEADTTNSLATNALTSKKFQTDSLHELSLLYFRYVC